MEFSILAPFLSVIGPEIGAKKFLLPYRVGPILFRTDPAFYLWKKNYSILFRRSAEKNGILAEKIQKSADVVAIGLYKRKYEIMRGRGGLDDIFRKNFSWKFLFFDADYNEITKTAVSGFR